jgi:hypothetical protein
MEEKKEIKVVKSYSLPPSQVAWLRNQAFQESTPEQPVSASSLLERIIGEAMQKSEQSPTTSEKKTARVNTLGIALVAN